MKVFVLIPEKTLDALLWVLQDPLGISREPETEYIFGYESDDEGWQRRIEKDFQFSHFSLKWTFRRIRGDKHGISRNVKALCQAINPNLIIAPKSALLALGELAQSQPCPVVLAQPRVPLPRDSPTSSYDRLLLLVKDNSESREALHWVCKSVKQRISSGLYVIHGYLEDDELKALSSRSSKVKDEIRQRHREILQRVGRGFSGASMEGKTALVRLVGRGPSLAEGTMKVFSRDYPPRDRRTQGGPADKESGKTKDNGKKSSDAKLDSSSAPSSLEPSPDLVIVAPQFSKKRSKRNGGGFGGQFTQHIIKLDADVLIFKTHKPSSTPKVTKPAPLISKPASSPVHAFFPSPIHTPRGAPTIDSPAVFQPMKIEPKNNPNRRWWQRILKTQKSFGKTRSRLLEEQEI